MNLCGVLLSGRDRFLRVCRYYGHKKNFYNIEIRFMSASSFGLAYVFLFFVVALARKLVEERLIGAFSRGLFSHSSPAIGRVKKFGEVLDILQP